MISPVLIRRGNPSAIDDLLTPDAVAGKQPEQRVIHCGISWGKYLAFDKKVGDDRPDPRLFYLDCELEIVTTSVEHERIKKWIAGPLSDYFEQLGTEISLADRPRCAFH